MTIQTQEIYKKLIDNYYDEIDKGFTEFPLSKHDFKKMMMREGLILSVPTIATKWDLLEANDIVFYRGNNSFINLEELNKAYTLMLDKKNKNKKNLDEEKNETSNTIELNCEYVEVSGVAQ